ncbi:MAG: hypothetical protein RLZ95_1610 [Bacteroidota bacterium]
MKIKSTTIQIASLLLAFVFLTLQVSAQSIPNLKDDKAVDNALGSEYLYVTRSIEYKGKVTTQTKLELESLLKAGLAKQIISKIKVVNNSKFSQITFNQNDKKGNNLPSEVIKYEFSTDIESKLSFTSPIIRYQDDIGEKRLYGLIAVVKKDFIDQNFTKLKFDLSMLSDKLDNILEGANSNTRVNQQKYNEFMADKNNLYSLIEVQNTLDPERILNDLEFQAKVKSLDNKLNSLLSSIESDDFQEALVKAKNLLYQNDARSEFNAFREAIKEYDLLIIKYPGNTTIIDAKQEALNYIEGKFYPKVSSNDFLEALNSIKLLGQIDQSFIIKYDEQKMQLVKLAFDSYMEKADKSLSNKDFNNAKAILKKVEEYKYYNSAKYDALLALIDERIFMQRIYEIDLLISTKDYVEAYRVIIETKKEFYTRNLIVLNERESKVVDYLTTQKVNEIKRKRPFTYQFQMGAGLISNFYDLQSNSDIANYQVQTASTTYEFGLYHKVRIHENILENGKDRSTANAIGLKVSVWVPNQSYSFATSSTTPVKGGLYFKSNIIEPQLSFFTMKLFNLNFGKIIGDVIDKDANMVINSKLDFYTLTFGLRPRIGNLMLNVNAKLISDMSSKSYVTANASLVLGLNFARRFKNYEYEQVHNTVLRMKNY